MEENSVASTMENLMSDDLSMNDNSKSFSEIEGATTDATPKDLLEKAQKQVKADSQDSSKPVKREAKTEARTTEGASEKQPQEAATEVSEDIEEEMIKSLKAMRGDQEYEVPEDANFKIKIDGEEVDVSLADLRNNFSGKTAWDKKFTELDTERQTFNADKSAVEKWVQEFQSIATSQEEGKELRALEYLATATGSDPLEFRRNIENQLFEKFQSMQGMSEDQVQAMRLQEENEHLRRQQESVNSRTAESQAIQEAESQVQKFQEAHNLANDELLELYDSVISEHGTDLSNDQVLELMQNATAQKQVFSGVESLLESMNPEFVNEENTNAVAELIMQNPDLTQEDVEQIVSEAFTVSKPKVSKKAKEAAKKVSKKQTETRTKKSYASFADLD